MNVITFFISVLYHYMHLIDWSPFKTRSYLWSIFLMEQWERALSIKFRLHHTLKMTQTLTSCCSHYLSPSKQYFYEKRSITKQSCSRLKSVQNAQCSKSHAEYNVCLHYQVCLPAPKVCEVHKAYLKQNTNYSGSNQALDIFHLNFTTDLVKTKLPFLRLCTWIHRIICAYMCICACIYIYCIFFPLLSHETTCDAYQIQAVRYQKFVIRPH